MVKSQSPIMRAVGVLALLGVLTLGAFIGRLVVAPPPLLLQYRGLHNEYIEVTSPRTWVNVAGSCITLDWKIDVPRPGISKGLKVIHHFACISEPFIPLLQFLESEPLLFPDVVRVDILALSPEIVTLGIIIVALGVVALRAGLLPSINSARWRQLLGVLTCIVIAAFIGSYIFQAVNPNMNVHTTDSESGTGVSFTVKPHSLLPDGCMNVDWNVTNGAIVRLNDEIVVPVGNWTICSAGFLQVTTLQIETNNNSRLIYALTAPLFDTEEIRIAVAATISLLLLAIYLLRLHELPGIRRWITAIGQLVLLVICLFSLVYRPINGFRLSSTTLSLPLGSILLLIIAGLIIIRLSHLFGLQTIDRPFRWLTQLPIVLQTIVNSLSHRVTVWLRKRRIRPVPLMLVALILLAFLFREYYMHRLGVHFLWTKYIEVVDEWVAAGRYTSLVYPPGYPFLILISRRISDDYLNVTGIIQALFDSLTILPLYYFLRTCRLPRLLIVMILLSYATYLPWAIAPASIMAESLTTPFLVWVIAALVWASERPTAWRWVFPGAIIGILALIRPDTIFLGGLAGLWLFSRLMPFHRLVFSSIALGIGISLFVGIWGVYNLSIHGVFNPTTNSGANGLWAGVGQIPNPYFYMYNAVHPNSYDEGMALQGYDISNWKGADRYWENPALSQMYDSYRRAVFEHPDIVFNSIMYRWRDILSFYKSFYILQNFVPVTEPRDVNNQRIAIWPEFSVPFVHFVENFGLVFWAAALILYRKNGRILLILLLPIALALFTIGIVYYEPRYVEYAYLSYIMAIWLCIWCLFQQRQRLNRFVRAVFFTDSVTSTTPIN